MDAANALDFFAAWRRACRVAIAAAVLLAAAPAAAQDTVRVEWALSPGESLVILNAYRLRGGTPDPGSVRGLLIERNPATAAGHRYDYRGADAAYAQSESQPFLGALGLSAVTLDTLANDGAGSDFESVLSGDEWARLLSRLLVEGGTEIREGAHRVIVRRVAEPVRSLAADDFTALFSAREPAPVLPHLRSGLIGLVGGEDGETDAGWINFGSVAAGDMKSVTRYLKNYGVRPVEAELSFSGGAADAGFVAGADRPLVVGPGDSVEVAFRFAPRQGGAQRDTVDLVADGELAARVIVNGEGMSAGLLRRFRDGLARWLPAIVAIALLAAVGAAARKRKAWPAFPRLGRGPAVPRPVPPTTDRKSAPSPAPPALPVDPSVRRHLVTARRAIEDGLAALGDGEDSGNGGRESKDGAAHGREQGHREGRAAENLEPPRPGEGDGPARVRDELEQRVWTLTTEVASLRDVRAENENLRGDRSAAAEALDAARREVNRLTGERDSLGARLHAVAGVLELSGEMVSEAGWPETQRRLPELGGGGKPRYLWAFEQLVRDLTAIFDEIAPRAGEGRLGAAVSAVLSGSNHNAGLCKVAEELERGALAARMGLAHPRELRTLPPERFYRDFVDRRFRPVIDNVAKLGMYARSRSPEIGMRERLSREGVDPELLERALALIEARMRMDFGVEVHMVRLFEERFDGTRHDTASHSTLRRTLPDLEASIGRLPPDTIYDITSVGLRCDHLGVSVRPVVAWVAPR